MLKHFSDIIFPAFSGDYIRGKRDSVPRYYYRQTNYLRKSTKYYEAALFIYFVAIGISLVYKLTIECMPQNFALIVFSSHKKKRHADACLFFLLESGLLRRPCRLRAGIVRERNP